MIHIISRREHLTLIDIINLDCFENLSLHKMSDSAFCHNRDRNRVLDALDHLRITHTGNAAGGTDVCRNPLQCHNGTGTSFLGNMRLLRSGNVHDHATL